jgi:hypothetical protein
MRKGVRTVKRSEPASITKEFFRCFDIHHLVVVEKKDVLSLIADRDLRTLKQTWATSRQTDGRRMRRQPRVTDREYARGTRLQMRHSKAKRRKLLQGLGTRFRALAILRARAARDSDCAYDLAIH